VQVQEEAQPYAGFARLPGGAVARCAGVARGEQFLNRVRGRVVRGGTSTTASPARATWASTMFLMADIDAPAWGRGCGPTHRAPGRVTG
jgi:hypothetical protein